MYHFWSYNSFWNTRLVLGVKCQHCIEVQFILKGFTTKLVCGNCSHKCCLKTECNLFAWKIIKRGNLFGTFRLLWITYSIPKHTCIQIHTYICINICRLRRWWACFVPFIPARLAAADWLFPPSTCFHLPKENWTYSHFEFVASLSVENLNWKLLHNSDWKWTVAFWLLVWMQGYSETISLWRRFESKYHTSKISVMLRNGATEITDVSTFRRTTQLRVPYCFYTTVPSRSNGDNIK